MLQCCCSQGGRENVVGRVTRKGGAQSITCNTWLGKQKLVGTKCWAGWQQKVDEQFHAQTRSGQISDTQGKFKALLIAVLQDCANKRSTVIFTAFTFAIKLLSLDFRGHNTSCSFSTQVSRKTQTHKPERYRLSIPIRVGTERAVT